MRYLIKDVKTEVGGGMACGPVSGPVIAELLLQDEEGKSSYHILAEVEGIPHFYDPDRSCIDGMLEFDNDTFEYVNTFYDDEIDDYEMIFDADHEEETIKIRRYLIYMVRASWDDVDTYKQETVGKYLDEIEIPNCDLENDFIEDYE